jgi:hypothetical protein
VESARQGAAERRAEAALTARQEARLEAEAPTGQSQERFLEGEMRLPQAEFPERGFLPVEERFPRFRRHYAGGRPLLQTAREVPA